MHAYQQQGREGTDSDLWSTIRCQTQLPASRGRFLGSAVAQTLMDKGGGVFVVAAVRCGAVRCGAGAVLVLMAVEQVEHEQIG